MFDILYWKQKKKDFVVGMEHTKLICVCFSNNFDGLQIFLLASSRTLFTNPFYLINFFFAVFVLEIIFSCNLATL